MLVETVLTLSAILGLLLAATVFVFHVMTGKREQRGDMELAAETVDKASDAAILEINKTAQLALEELDEKYQKLLFLYQLLDDKQSVLEQTPVPQTSVSQAVAASETVPVAPETVPVAPAAASYAPPPKYAQIKELQEQGLTIKAIAKQLGLGKGEVEMVINLALQSSKQAVLSCK